LRVQIVLTLTPLRIPVKPSPRRSPVLSDRGAATAVIKPCSRSAAAHGPVLLKLRGVQHLLTWVPTRLYDVWHDRAVFHFLSGAEVETYRDVLHRAIGPGGFVIMATFAPDGPERCSGLPVTRYSADELGSALGTDFKVVKQRREVHTTPGGGVQPFTWIAARCVLTYPISPPGE
jgi:hypothetical protein